MRYQFRFFIKALSILTIASVAGVFFSTQEAKADFRVCNDTSSLVGVALGYREEGRWVSEGWFRIPAETCNSVIKGTLNSRFYYIYAEDSSQGGQWRGDIFLCTDEIEFKIEGVEDCFKRGYIRSGFFEIDTGNRSDWLTRLTDQSKSTQ